MTTPRIPTVNRQGSRFYVNPSDGRQAPSVTSIIDQLPKPFLKFWAAKVVAEAAVEHLPEVVGLVSRGNPEGAVDFLKRTPSRDTGQAADTGSSVHDLFERRARGAALGRVHPDLTPYVRHFDAFLDSVQPKFLHLEATVWSDDPLYAGSFDAIADIDGEVVIMDWKTTRSGVHAEVALQLAAYARAATILDPEDGEVPMPSIDAGAVLHVRPERWQLVPVAITDEVFDVFCHLIPVFGWSKEMSKKVLGRPAASGLGGESNASSRCSG